MLRSPLALAALTLLTLTTSCSELTDDPPAEGEGEGVEGEGEGEAVEGEGEGVEGEGEGVEGEGEGPVEGVDLLLEGEAPLITYRDFPENACEVNQALVSDFGVRALVSLQLALVNSGTEPVNVPAGARTAAPCGGEDVVADFVAWRLVSTDGTVHAEGTADVALVALNPGDIKTIDVGSTTPGSILIDLTEIPAGNHFLELTIDPASLFDERASNNTLSLALPTLELACEGIACGAVCCPAEKCEDGVCMLPDLSVSAQALVQSERIVESFFGDESCGVFEGCVDAPGNRKLLNFSTTTPNLGNADLVVGRPDENPLFSFSACHEHYHFDEYADYRLLDADGTVVAQGHKQAFCLMDLDRIDDDGGEAQYTCDDQGISRGWADTYGRQLDCQWIDITDVPGGEYTLEIRVNPLRIIPELDYTNNITRITVSIPDDPSICIPETEICGDGRDQNCDDVPDDGCPLLVDNDTCQDGITIDGSGTFFGEIVAGNASDITPSCGGAGGELFFRFAVANPSIVYLSTYGSDFDTTLSVFADQGCASDQEVVCVDDGCADQNGAGGGHFIGVLEGGAYVAAVKAKDAASLGRVTFKIQNAGCLDAQELTGAEVFGDTSDGLNNTAPTCGDGEGGGGPDELWYFTTCPGAREINVQTCGGGLDFDSMLELREGACLGQPVDGACNDDVIPGTRICSIVETILEGDGAGDGLWFLLVDGYDGEDEGAYPIRMETP